MIATIFNSVADGWGDAILRASWQGGIAIALVWSICAIAPLVVPRIRCWLWRLAGLKLIFAAVWAMPLVLPLLAAQVPSVARPVTPSQSSVTVTLTPSAPTEISAPPAEFFTQSAISPPHFQPMQSTPIPVVVKSNPIPWPRVLFIAWLVGVIFGIFRMAMSLRGTQRMRGDAITVTDHRILASLRRMCSRMAITHPPEIAVCPDIIAPVLLGPFRPTILIPDFKFSSATQFEMALAHELAHFRRRDLFWSFFDAIIGLLFFFHPLVWLFRRESAQCADAACDAEALAATDFDRQTYARLLLELADNHAGILPGGFAMLGMIQNFGSLKKRLRNLMKAGPMSRRALLTSGLLIAALAIPGLMNWRLVRRASAAPTTTSSVDSRVDPSAEPSAKDLEILSALARPVPVNQLPKPTEYHFDRQPLPDAIQALANALHEKIQVDWPALNAAGLYESKLVVLDARYLQFSTCLQMLLDEASDDPGKFSFSVVNGEVEVTSADRIKSGVYTKVYDIHDLVRRIPRNAKDIDFEYFEYAADSKLLEEIRSVDPLTWYSNNPKALGTIAALPAELVITQKAQVHRDLAALLRKLRGGAGRIPVADNAAAAADVFQRTLDTQRALERELPKVQFDATALMEIIGGSGGHGFLSDVMGTPIQADWSALDAIGIEKTTPVTLSESNVPFASVLQQVLDQVAGAANKLRFAITADGTIAVSSADGLGISKYDTFDELKDQMKNDPYIQKQIQDAKDYFNSHSADGN